METNMQDIEKAKILLGKLLALTSSSNENEAARAMEKAKVLMDKYNLRTIDVAEDGTGAYVANREIKGTTLVCQSWEAQLGWIIAKAFDGRAIRNKGGRGVRWTFTFIAGRSDLEIIVDLYNRLRKTIIRMSKQYVAGEKDWTYTPVKTLHNNYRHGMVQTIHSRLKELTAKTTPEYTGGKDLMVVKSKAVSQVVDKMFPKLRKAPSTKINYEQRAFLQGAKDGKKVSLNRSVAGSKQRTKITA